jgi:hypothetical protein
LKRESEDLQLALAMIEQVGWRQPKKAATGVVLMATEITKLSQLLLRDNFHFFGDC